jgi:drug/metabolite transporter (DMT)-like permease
MRNSRLRQTTFSLSDQSLGVVLILIAMLSLSLAPTFIKWGIAADEGPIPLLTMRLVTGAIALWIGVLLFKPQLARIDPRGLMACGTVGVANSISLTCFYLALEYIDASLATVIFAMHPIGVLAILVARGEKLTGRQVIRLIMALGGLVLLIGIGGEAIEWTGVALAFGTATFYALYIVLIQEALRGYPPQQTTPYVITIMAAILTVVYMLQGDVSLSFSGPGWAAILFTGLISTAVARFLLFAGIQKAGSGPAALLGPFETLMVVVWAVLLLGERLTTLQAAGGALILISSALAAPRYRRLPRASRAFSALKHSSN